MKTIWIIGASSGIGAELARRYGAQGHRVAVSARRLEKLEELSQSADAIFPFALDVTNADRVAAVHEEILNRFHKVDLVIVASAVWRAGTLEELGADFLAKAMATNYIGAVNVVAAVAPAMGQRRAGHIALIASVAGFRGLPNACAYGPTKAAMINLAESIRPELESAGVDLSLINPGFVDTPMTRANAFPMPFMVSAEHAAARIMTGLEKRRYEIGFPRRLLWVMKLLRLLPNGLFFAITRGMRKS